MKHGFFQCLTCVFMVDLGFNGTFIKREIQSSRACAVGCLPDKSLWGGRIRRDDLKFYIIQGKFPDFPATPAFSVLWGCFPGANQVLVLLCQSLLLLPSLPGAAALPCFHGITWNCRHRLVDNSRRHNALCLPDSCWRWIFLLHLIDH